MATNHSHKTSLIALFLVILSTMDLILAIWFTKLLNEQSNFIYVELSTTSLADSNLYNWLILLSY